MVRTALLSSCVLALLWCPLTAGTLGLQQTGNDAAYVGPDAPSTTSFDYDYTISFATQARLELNTASPSGDAVFVLEPDVMNETDRGFFSSGEAQLALVSTTIDFTNEKVTDDNIDQIESVEITWWDPQFDDGFLTTSLQIQSIAPNVVTIPEPTAAILLGMACIVFAVFVRSGRCRLGAVTIMVLSTALAPAAHADDQHDHSHPEIHTPLGFKLATERQRDGLTMVIRESGHAIVFAPDFSWFARDAGPMGSSVAWRWQDPSSGPFQTSDCLYESPFGNSVCNSDLYALQDGIYDHPTLPQLGRSFNHVELPGHLTDLSLMMSDPELFAANLWIGGTTKTMQRTPDGMKIIPDDEFNVGTGPWLVLPNVSVPEPSAVMLFGLALLLLTPRLRVSKK